MSAWPKLSATLTHPKGPDVCQACGDLGPPPFPPGNPLARLPDGVLMRRWRECDDADRSTSSVVVLCQRCSETIVGPHPRLYVELGKCEPDPGSMPMCLSCRHRRGTGCAMAVRHGGPGLELVVPEPTNIHVCRSPRSASGWVKLWPAWPASCDKREVVDATGPPTGPGGDA